MLKSRWTRRRLAAALGALTAPLTAPSVSWAAVRATAAERPRVRLDIRDFGASGDGTTKATAAIRQALDRCAVLGGGEVVVPAGAYLTGALEIGRDTTLRLEAGAVLQGSPDLTDYPLTQVRWEGHWIKGYTALIWARDVENITITGAGRIVGSDAIKGRVDRATGLRHPALIEFVACSKVRVETIATQQNDMWSIHPVYCDDIGFHGLSVTGGADGIDIDSCRRVTIENCRFDTGDDCISLKSGRGEEGYVLARPTEDVRISNCVFNDRNWACIGIGSETSGGIARVRVDHCQCLGAKTFAIYIKSRPGRGAYIEDITMTDLEVSGTGAGFLRLNLLDSGKQDDFPVPGDDGIPRVRNLAFSHIRVRDVPVLVDAVNIHPAKPVDGFTLSDVQGTCAKGIALANIRHAVLRDIDVSGFAGPKLSTRSVSGKGFEGAVALPDVPPPESVAPNVKPFNLG